MLNIESLLNSGILSNHDYTGIFLVLGFWDSFNTWFLGYCVSQEVYIEGFKTIDSRERVSESGSQRAF